MNPQDDHFVALGAEQRNKSATYGKGPRNAPPTYDLFSLSVTLDDDEDPSLVVKRRAISKPKTNGAGAKKGPTRKDIKRFSPIQVAKLESKSLFDVPSSDSEDDAYSRSRAISKKRKLEHPVTKSVQDGVYDDESLQRHIAAEVQRDQEHLQLFTQPKATAISRSAACKTMVRQDKFDTGAQRPKAKTSAANKTIKMVTTPVNLIAAKAPKKRQTLSTSPKSQSIASNSRSSSSLAKDQKAPPLLRPSTIHSVSNTRRISVTHTQTQPIEEDVMALACGTSPIGAIQSMQGTSPSASPGGVELQQTEIIPESSSRTPRPTRRNLVDAISSTPRAKSLRRGDKRNQSPSNLGVQSMQLSSPPETPPAKQQTRSSAAIGNLADKFKPASAPIQARKRIIDRLCRHSSHSSTESDDEEEDDETADPDAASTQSSAPSPSQPPSTSRVTDKLMSDEIMPEDDLETQQTTKSLQSSYGGAKVTYQHQRSYLTEDMVDEADLFKIPILPDPMVAKSSRRSKATGKVPGVPGLPSLQPSFEIGEDLDDATTGPTRNIHELRQAGGNARLLGSMEAILDDIDPTRRVSISTRRNGLLDLYRSLAQPVSCQAFIDHGLTDQLIAQLDVSLDDITGILVMSCFAAVLGQNCPMPLLTLIDDARVFGFLGARLQGVEDLKVIVGKRISNLSRVMQQELIQFSKSLLASTMWTGETPSCLTARTLSMHCLEEAVRHLREAGCAVDALSQQLVTSLVDIAVSAADIMKTSSDLASNISSTEFRRAISILEYTTTISPTTDMYEMAWTTDSIKQTSQLLPMLCNQSGEQWGKAQLLVLRLCLNLTNGRDSTCEIFGKTEVVHAVVSIVLSGFRGLDEENDEELYAIVLDNVVLALGLLINLAESCDDVRLQFLKRAQGNNTPLDTLLQLFNSNVARASEVSALHCCLLLKANANRSSPSGTPSRMSPLAISRSSSPICHLTNRLDSV